MRFEELKGYIEQKVIDIDFIEKENLNIKIDDLIVFLKNGASYYIKDVRDEKKEYFQISLKKNNDRVFIDELIDRKKTYLAKLTDMKTIEVLVYNEEEMSINNFSILRNDYFKIKKNKNSKKYKELKKYIERDIEKNYVFKSQGMSYIFFGKLKDSEKEEYSLLGINSILTLEIKKMSFIKDDKTGFIEAFSVVKEEKINNNSEKYSYTIIKIKENIEFTEDILEYVEDMEIKARINQLKNDSSSYLKIWEKYADIEKKILRENLDTYYKISDVKVKSGETFLFEIQLNKKHSFKEGDTLIITKENPEILIENDSDEVEKNFFKNLEYVEVTIEKVPTNSSILISCNQEKDLEEEKDSYIFYSIKGDKTVNDRREKARELIANNKTPMRELNLIIEGKKVIKEKAGNYEALSIQTKESLFPKYEPTENQKEAIQIALNTPDIAIIQGPPGTGKTTVITAILQRLSEERKEVGNISGNNLLTSFQHDAVNNALSRIKILGLPAEKYGIKAGMQEELVNKNFKNYMNKVINIYYEENPELKRESEEKELREIYNDYADRIRESLDEIEIKNLIRKLKSFSRKYQLTKEILEELERIEDDYRGVSRTCFVDKSYFYKIPISENMLIDDGKYFIEKSIKIIEDAIKNNEIQASNFIKELEILKNSLIENKLNFYLLKECKISILSKLAPVEYPFMDKAFNQKIAEIFEKISSIINNIVRESKNFKERIKLKYLDELENNPLRVRDTIREYITTFGATCQQTQGKEILNAKRRTLENKVNNGKFYDETRTYENVLIDEAARSNPSDLLIPMSMAKRRIILVGDHKQLPHLIDENILEYLKDEEKKNGGKDVKSYIEEQIKESMFEYLKKSCEKLEKYDGIKRVIMLNRQYRMHPKMGAFVSKHFYEGKLENGLEEDKFDNRLKDLERKAFAWFDISNKYQEKKKNNNSFYRNIEAKEIAKFIYKHIDSEEAKGKNFGIITFYSSQKDEIFKELANEENKAYKGQELIVIKDNNYTINDKYKLSNEEGINEKIRIGSVDAFQGMEFNFVCLSMVRSNDEKNIRRKFGFLTNRNRLCVAMSRQKELLVVFGDSKMLEGEKHTDIEVLQEYLKMCKEDGEYGKFESIL
ncbi:MULTISPECIES: ATP-binding protein [Fusobacterium]|uniref:DEAD/DEAH box helicase family protein n=1 Tax=Fusobacterium TaxID=848 RepID=UPI0004534132|nr:MULTISPECIES: ATP-binding protein [Fusobacterium]EUB36303.1 AAA domain protein [Fusobacterium sp. OBRC1]WRL72401.1 AAA domain-containing protein [Fusobacterium polymorphum]